MPVSAFRPKPSGAPGGTPYVPPAPAPTPDPNTYFPDDTGFHHQGPSGPVPNVPPPRVLAEPAAPAIPGAAGNVPPGSEHNPANWNRWSGRQGQGRFGEQAVVRGSMGPRTNLSITQDMLKQAAMKRLA